MSGWIDRNGWIHCPTCGNKTRTKVNPDTVLKHFPLLLCYQIHLRRHGSGHRRAQDVAFAQPCPPAVFVDGMDERQLPLAVQRFGDRAGLRLDDAQPVAGEVRAVSRVDADHGVHPPFEA